VAPESANIIGKRDHLVLYMTSFLIEAHIDRKGPKSWMDDPGCAFCRIIRGDLAAYRVLETDKVISILDILPLRSGHVLVIPKIHCSRISDLPPEYAAATGETISRVGKALTQVLNNTALNVVGNQEYAQAVFHVHYHVIPAPRLGEARPARPMLDPPTHELMHKMEFDSREELDEEFAQGLVVKLRSALTEAASLSHL